MFQNEICTRCIFPESRPAIIGKSTCNMSMMYFKTTIDHLEHNHVDYMKKTCVPYFAIRERHDDGFLGFKCDLKNRSRVLDA